MRLQDRGRRHRRDGTGETVFDRFGLARIGDDADDFARGENLADRNRNGMRRHVVQGFEPPFAHLLPPARLVQLHDDERLVGFEIGRRVVECEMSVFTDADERAIDWRFSDRGARATTNLLWILIAVEEVVTRHSRGTDQTFEQIPAKTRGMIGGEADVFVEVKHVDARPVHVAALFQRLQEHEQRRAPARKDARAPARACTRTRRA